METSQNEHVELLCAVLRGNAQRVRELVAAGADVNSTSIILLTPLFVAAGLGHRECVDALIAGGANVNTQEAYKFTPLMQACKDVSCMEALVAAGADINVSNELGMTALMIAIGEGNTAGVRLLLRAGADVNKKTVLDATALSLAQGRDPDIIRVLIDAGADTSVLEHNHESSEPKQAART